jgi:hypothetical protein
MCFEKDTKIVSYERHDSQDKRVKGLCSIATFKIKLQSCKSEISCGSISVNIPALYDTSIEAVSLICMSSTPDFLYIKDSAYTAWWQRAGMTQSHKVLHLKDRKMSRKIQTTSSGSWIRDHGSQVSHVSLVYMKSEVQTNYNENQGYYSVTSKMIKQTNVDIKQCYRNK